ncbi:PucR family transcriptional regulator [Microbacterium esteraromaticum]|nr:PucR family transcriptional regulator [Microbacterium esteraromaticum]
MAVDDPTLRTLLRRRDLELTLLSPTEAKVGDRLDRPLRWVHSSDLLDPTPFLADDLLLLTTGIQLTDGDAAQAQAYVTRLADRGVAGLGFGADVHHAGAPSELIAACAALGMPLFEVPYRTPFIAVARAHAEAIAAQAYARRSWALDAQRALAIAALRPRGLESTLSELARRIDVWVGMFDAGGALTHEHPPRSLAEPAAADLSAHVGELLARGAQAAQSVTADGQPFLLFTLGRGGHLRGVIALATDALDPEARTVVTSVIAMAGLAREQSEQLNRSRARLHSQVLQSLLRDDPALARRVLGSLPVAPVLVGVASADAPAEAIVEWCERRRLEDGLAYFGAAAPSGMVLVVSAAQEQVYAQIADRFSAQWGVSAADGYGSFARMHEQAVFALGRSDDAVTRYADTASASMIGALSTDEARLVAESRLAPIRQVDAASGSDLERTLRVWLEHDAVLDASANALGVHRHTLRSRIAQASALLGVDLATFPARAELWIALHAAGE